jgi:hypothetical protein
MDSLSSSMKLLCSNGCCCEEPDDGEAAAMVIVIMRLLSFQFRTLITHQKVLTGCRLAVMIGAGKRLEFSNRNSNPSGHSLLLAYPLLIVSKLVVSPPATYHRPYRYRYYTRLEVSHTYMLPQRSFPFIPLTRRRLLTTQTRDSIGDRTDRRR